MHGAHRISRVIEFLGCALNKRATTIGSIPISRTRSPQSHVIEMLPESESGIMRHIQWSVEGSRQNQQLALNKLGVVPACCAPQNGKWLPRA